MARQWTPEQLRALETTDRTVLLSAAAGSGKTATLTERLIRMITDEKEPLDVSRMVVVTFTRSAAAELRERIARALDEALAQNPKSRHLLRSSLLLPSATIRTIDSFCNDLVRGNAESLGIPLYYRIPDPAEVKLLMAEVMDRLIEDAYDGTFRAEGLDVAYLAECATDARNVKELGPLLTKLHTSLDGYPDGLAIFRRSLEALEKAKKQPFFETPWGEIVKNETVSLLRDYAEGLGKARREALIEGDPLYLSSLDGAVAEVERFAISAAESAGVSYTAAKTVLSSFVCPSLRSGDDKLLTASLAAKRYTKRFEGALRGLLTRFFAWEEKDIPYAAGESARLTRTVLLLLEEFDRRYTAEKRRAGLCTYADLEHLAYRLLYGDDGKTTALARELRDSYDAICIDEYQDVNDLQHLIFEAIAKPHNRFMVGDIKQSIYAFRGAKPSIFASLRASLPSYEEGKESTVLYLTKNFRSHGHLIDFNNAVFDFLFDMVGEGIGYRAEDALVCGKEPPAFSLPLPELLYSHKQVGSDDKTTEWDIIAEKIRDLLANGKRDDGSPIKPSDIAILYRSGTARPAELSDALLSHGIPVLTKDTRHFFENPEILLALCLLHTVNNPRRDIYLAGLLRSPLYGFTMEELIALRRTDGTTLYDALCAYTETHPDFLKGKRFLSELSRFRSVSEGESADRLCRRLFEETALYAVTDTEGKKRLRTLYDCARKYEGGAFHGLYRFLSYLNEIYESGASLGADRVLGDSEGVKIMTMHASKGLEFPVCIVADTKPYERGHKEKLRFHPSLGIALSVRDESGLAVLDNPFYIALEAAEERDALEEEIRVLYVALTRASEQMYITAHSSAKADTVKEAASLLSAFPSRTMLGSTAYFEWILAALMRKSHLGRSLLDTNTAVRAYVRGTAETEEYKEEVSTEEKKEEHAPTPEEIQHYYKLYKERFSFTYPHAAAELPGKVSVSRLYPAYLDEEEPFHPAEQAFLEAAEPPEAKEEKHTVPFFLSGVEGNVAAKAGIATHLFLQFCDFSALKGESDEELRSAVLRELDRLLASGFLHKLDAERVRVEEIVNFAKSDLQKEILQAKSVRREFRFNTWLPASLFSDKAPEKYEGQKIFTQGVIDLLLETEDGALILADYKTDRLTRDMLADPEKARELLLTRHATQLRYYAIAAERIFGKKPRAVKIYSLHAGKSFSLPL